MHVSMNVCRGADMESMWAGSLHAHACLLCGPGGGEMLCS